MIHKDAFHILIPAGLITAGCAVFGWIGLLSPDLLDWPSPSPLIVKVGLFVLGSAPLLWFLAFRLHLRSLWVYRNTKPITMSLQIKVEKDSESTNYYALLFSAEAKGKVQEIPVYQPRWNLQLIGADEQALVFIDPKSGKPLVIEINGRRLWTMAL
jgi:hypothetical protein